MVYSLALGKEMALSTVSMTEDLAQKVRDVQVVTELVARFESGQASLEELLTMYDLKKGMPLYLSLVGLILDAYNRLRLVRVLAYLQREAQDPEIRRLVKWAINVGEQVWRQAQENLEKETLPPEVETFGKTQLAEMVGWIDKLIFQEFDEWGYEFRIP